MALQTVDFQQAKSGAYSAMALRRVELDSGGTQAGVVGATDLQVVQHAAGNMSVDVSAGSAFLQGGYTTRQGLYHVYNDAVVNLAIAANGSGQPRVDSVVLRLYDTIDGGSAQDNAVLELWQGVGTAGAQITSPAAAGYRAGALATPTASTILRLADILVANGAVSILTANIVDRRPWAKGYLNSAPGVTSNPTVSATATPGTQITDLTLTGEFSGAPVELRYAVDAQNSSPSATLQVLPRLDGGSVPGYADDDIALAYFLSTSASPSGLGDVLVFTPAAGRHTISINAWTSSGTITAVNKRRHMSVRECIQQLAGN